MTYYHQVLSLTNVMTYYHQVLSLTNVMTYYHQVLSLTNVMTYYHQVLSLTNVMTYYHQVPHIQDFCFCFVDVNNLITVLGGIICAILAPVMVVILKRYRADKNTENGKSYNVYLLIIYLFLWYITYEL